MQSERLLKWKAIYDDGTELNELEGSFDDIDKDKVSKFILDGLNTTFTHYTDTGKITINNNTLEFKLDGKTIGISKDVINFKEKLKMAIGNPQMEKNIIGYYTGWRESNENFKSIEILLWVDMMRRQIKVRGRFNPIKNLNSRLEIDINGALHATDLKFSNLDKRHEFVIEIFNQK